jgi:hypothetical protein
MPQMKSFRLQPRAETHPASVLVAWIAAGGLVSVLVFRLAIIASLDRVWYMESDSDPGHWTRSVLPTLLVGCVLGAIAGFLHTAVAAWRRRKRDRYI